MVRKTDDVNTFLQTVDLAGVPQGMLLYYLLFLFCCDSWLRIWERDVPLQQLCLFLIQLYHITRHGDCVFERSRAPARVGPSAQANDAFESAGVHAL